MKIIRANAKRPSAPIPPLYVMIMKSEGYCKLQHVHVAKLHNARVTEHLTHKKLTFLGAKQVYKSEDNKAL